MTDVLAFITARLDEDEAITATADDYIEHFNPTRLAADIAAKRRILEDYLLVTADAAIVRRVQGDTIEVASLDLVSKALWPGVCYLASTWSDHPDYQPEWTPND